MFFFQIFLKGWEWGGSSEQTTTTAEFPLSYLLSGSFSYLLYYQQYFEFNTQYHDLLEQIEEKAKTELVLEMVEVSSLLQNFETVCEQFNRIFSAGFNKRSIFKIFLENYSKSSFHQSWHSCVNEIQISLLLLAIT